MEFVDVKNDVAFRKIFGNENKTTILISFLNAILQLEGNYRIQSLRISNPYQMPILPNLKTSILDVRAKDFMGKTFIVEMQVAEVASMDKRLLYYTTKEYSQQIVSGDKYTELNPVIFIGIFDFPFTENVGYYSHHGICNLQTGERVIKDLNFYFIELRKFHKRLNELANTMDKWIFFIKEASNLDIIPENLDDEGLREAYYDANKNSWTQTELDAYLYAGMREQDAKGRVAVAEQKALNKGREKREAELVIEMHKEGMTLQKIAKIAKISEEKVAQIIERYVGTEG